MKKISVIVNFHNGEKYLKNCIDSILNQKYSNLEIILWDNFSQDKSKKIIDNYKDKRIKYFYNKKKTPLYKARNQAILASTGELIAFLDSDDWWEQNYLSSRAEYFLDTKYDYFCSNVFMFHQKKNKKIIYKKYKLPEGKLFEFLAEDYFVIISAVIFKKEVFNKFGFFNDKLNILGDFEFMMKISKFCYAHSINLPLVNYRVHEKNYSKLFSKLFYQEYNEWFDTNYQKDNNKEFFSKINYFRNRLSYLEIKYLLLEKKKSLYILKKIFIHKSNLEKIKFLILFFIPKKLFRYLIA